MQHFQTAKSNGSTNKTSRWHKRVVRRLDRHFGSGVLGSTIRVKTDQPIAALTFDDGPHPVNTPHVLEILAKHDVKATFFMLGERAVRYPEIVEQVAQAGHTIGNHSWDHQPFPHLTGRQRRASIRATQKALGSYASKLIRPPYGDQDLPSRLDTLWFGMEMILWDIPADDWLDHTGEEIFHILQNKLGPGSIILMHDRLQTAEKASYADRTATLQGLELLLAGNPDYAFATIPELLKHGQPVRRFQPQVGNLANISELVKIDD